MAGIYAAAAAAAMAIVVGGAIRIPSAYPSRPIGAVVADLRWFCWRYSSSPYLM